METKTCDLLIIGSGAGAQCAALTALSQGLKVLMVEKEEKFGGASARAGGGLWIPNTPHAAKAGVPDSREKAITYFRHETGNRYNESKVGAFLDNGPAMLEFVESASSLRFHVLAEFPDYHCESPGGGHGRSLFPYAWDAAELGKEIHRLRPVLMAASFMSMQIGVSEVPTYLTASRKLSSFAHVAKCMARRVVDQVRAGRTMRLTSGNAVVGGLAAAAFRRGLELWTSAPARSLIREGDRVTGAIVERFGEKVRVEARRAVIVSTGGFPHDSVRRAQLFPQGASAPEVWAMLPYGNAGEGIRMIEAVGGKFNSDMTMPIALTPITTLRTGEGRLETIPVFFNRGAPGVISVTRQGKRFVNEARSYHDWGVALLKEYGDDQEAEAWIVCDHRALRKYGLGIIKPAPFPIKSFLKSGYLKTGRTPRELAISAGIDPDGLERTFAEFNRNADRDEDPAFHRGSTDYERAGGDAEYGGNPCIGPLSQAPYYAIRVFAGCVATFAGIEGDQNAQVIGTDGAPIAGLYAIGNDMASITGGDYISGGCTLGPAMTFGYIAANHIAGLAASEIAAPKLVNSRA
ncbi:FAD-dependent oxidoreductase [Sphingobium nicotianae]|uniref:FAD-dependent oxidoreductase n=1 Tax=Sphingobium nicotianae TaxID=2782607 RepID=A0A9X1IPR7_9SPHN|nr:FAD-dependent oxidoreductase [Sphingobium nicotianae]MBT2186076.1 FAD-dependent oxidoreductase [Sphingobium nicotianae]